MRRTLHHIVLILTGILSLSACRKAPSEALSQGQQIWLRASMATARPETRAPYELEEPTSLESFDAAVWASTVSCNYPYNAVAPDLGGASSNLKYHTAVYFEDEEDQLLRGDALYPSAGTTVYFIGLHPNAGWSANTDGTNNTSTNFTFTGKEDVMYAPQVSGNITLATANPPEHPHLHFFHLLTLLRVKLYAENNDVKASWGKLTSMTLGNQQTTLGIDLSSVPDVSSLDFATRQGNVAAKVSFSGATSSLNFCATGTDNTLTTEYPSGCELATEATEVAYVMCQPVNATEGEEESRTNEYTLTLNTQNRTSVAVNVDLKTAEDAWFTGSTMGREFTITLKLMAGGYIAASATVTDWETGGYVIIEVEE